MQMADLAARSCIMCTPRRRRATPPRVMVLCKLCNEGFGADKLYECPQPEFRRMYLAVRPVLNPSTVACAYLLLVAPHGSTIYLLSISDRGCFNLRRLRCCDLKFFRPSRIQYGGSSHRFCFVYQWYCMCIIKCLQVCGSEINSMVLVSCDKRFSCALER